jgi:hypothetical protein
MKLWCLTEGQYSDKSIVGIFSSLEKVNEYIENDKRVKINYYKELFSEGTDEELLEYSYNDLNEPFEIELDSVIIDKDKFPFLVYMKKNGDSTNVCLEDSISIEKYWVNTRKSSNNGWDVLFYVNAKDKEHAIKIANERRVQLIASGEL